MIARGRAPAPSSAPRVSVLLCHRPAWNMTPRDDPHPATHIMTELLTGVNAHSTTGWAESHEYCQEHVWVTPEKKNYFNFI